MSPEPIAKFVTGMVKGSETLPFTSLKDIYKQIKHQKGTHTHTHTHTYTPTYITDPYKKQGEASLSNK